MTDTAAESILVWGLTGAGKTSVSAALAADLGLQHVSGFTIRRQLLGLSEVDTAAERADWLFSSAALKADEARLRGSTAEDDLDAILLQRLTAGPPAVFDTWFLPWTAPPSTFSICLDVAMAVRTRRIAAALASAVPLADVADSIQRKDERSAAYALQRYGVDILRNRDPFHVIVALEIDVPFQDVLTLLSKLSRLHFGWGSGDRIRADDESSRVDLLRRVPADLRRALARE